MQSKKQRLHISIILAVHTIVLALNIILLGCQKRGAMMGTGDLVVIPGKGIPGLCEVGMSLSEIKHNARDVTIHSVDCQSSSSEEWKAVQLGLIPEVAIVANFERGQPLKLFEYHVQSYTSKTIPAINITRPFAGRIKSGPSFANGNVSKKEVEMYFGELPVDTNATAYFMYGQSSIPFCLRRPDGIEELWYLDKGITFFVHSNIVTSFYIYQPHKQLQKKLEL